MFVEEITLKGGDRAGIAEDKGPHNYPKLLTRHLC